MSRANSLASLRFLKAMLLWPSDNNPGVMFEAAILECHMISDKKFQIFCNTFISEIKLVGLKIFFKTAEVKTKQIETKSSPINLLFKWENILFSEQKYENVLKKYENDKQDANY
jgi:hypothetical protein